MLIRALKVKKVSDGLYSVKLPVRELSNVEQDVLDDLFPHLQHCVSDLLDKEALLDAIVGPDGDDAVIEEDEEDKEKRSERRENLIKEAIEKHNEKIKNKKAAADSGDDYGM